MKQDHNKPDWWIFGGEGAAQARLERLPEPPPWRRFDAQTHAERGRRFIPTDEDIDLVNAALYLRRPLLITGKPGVGKTSLTYAVAEDLDLGEVLRWSITTSTTLKDGLYRYDASRACRTPHWSARSRAGIRTRAPPTGMRGHRIRRALQPHGRTPLPSATICGSDPWAPPLLLRGVIDHGCC